MKKRVLFLIITTLFMFIPFYVDALSGSVVIDCASQSLKIGKTTDCDVYYNATSGKITGFSSGISGNGLIIESFVKSTKGGSSWTGNNWEKGNGTPEIKLTSFAKEGKVHVGTIKVTLDSSAKGKGVLTLSNIKVTDENDKTTSIGSETANITVASSDIKLKKLTINGEDVLDTMTYNSKASTVNVYAETNDINTKIVSGTGKVKVACGSNDIYVEVKALDGSTKKYAINIDRLCNNNSYLRDLYAESYKIKPDFQFDKYDYQVTVESKQSTLKIDAYAAEETSKVSGAGKVKIKYGLNDLVIKVTAEDGSLTNYKLQVYRVDDRDTEYNLSNITVSDTNIVFDESKSKYSAYVEYDVDSVEIKATTVSKKASVSGAGKKNLEVGTNVFKIYGIAENGSKKTYTIEITRKAKDGRDTNNTLANLVVSEYDFKFESDQDTYEIESNTDIKKLNITAKPASAKAKVEIIGNKNFAKGSNTVRIRVTAENGDVKEYKIIVTIKGEEDKTEINVDDKKDDSKSLIIILIAFGVVIVGVSVFIIIRKKKGDINLFSDEAITDVVKEVLEEREKEENNNSSDE